MIFLTDFIETHKNKMVTRRGLWLRRHMVIIIMLMFFISLTIILIPGWSAVLNKNQNITSVLHKTLTKSKQVLEQRYQHIQKLGKSIEHHYGDLKKWGKYLLTTNSIKRYKDLTCGKDTKPHRSIFYIKIHDTKSNILRNIFLIYGREYNLTVCMDAEKIWSANSPRKLDSVGLTKTKEERCQIVAEQLVYSTEIGKMLDTKLNANKTIQYNKLNSNRPYRYYILRKAFW